MVKVTIDIPAESNYSVEGVFAVAAIVQEEGISMNLCGSEGKWSLGNMDHAMRGFMQTYLERLGPLGVIHLGELLSQVVDQQIKEEVQDESNCNLN